METRVSVPKVFRRGSRWYIRVQVPKAMQERLRRKEYWVALGTTDKSEALRIATAKTQEKRTEIASVFQRLSGLRETITFLNEDQRLALGREVYSTMASNPVDYLSAYDPAVHKSLAEYAAFQETTLEGVIEKLKVGGGNHPAIKQIALLTMEQNSIRIPPNEPAYQDFLEIVVDAFIAAKRNELAKLRGMHVSPAADPRFVDPSTGEPRSFVPLNNMLVEAQQPKPRLTDLVDRFLANPNKLRTEKTKSSIRGYLEVVIQILGDDKPVDTIKEADCERVRDLIAELPPNFKKLAPLRDRPTEEMARIAREKNMPRLSPTGVNNYVRWFITFLIWCQRKGIIAKVPVAFSEIKVADPVRKQDKRLPFSDSQLSAIFHSEVFHRDQRESCLFWVPLIALWNGMRSNEICQLDAADLRQESGIWGFDITHLSATGALDKTMKTESSIRMIPVHPRLIDLGLLEFRASRPRSSKLFGDITRGSDGYYSTNFSKKVNRYLKKIDVHGPRHKFHSFRHNFRDALRRGRVDREIGKALGGWTSGSTDAFDIYGSGYSLEDQMIELRRVDYPDLDLSHLMQNG